MKKWPMATFFICFTSLSLYDLLPFQERYTWKFALPLSTDSLLTLVPFHAIFIVPIAVKKEESVQILLFFAQNLCFFGKEGKLCCESPSATMKKNIWKK